MLLLEAILKAATLEGMIWNHWWNVLSVKAALMLRTPSP